MRILWLNWKDLKHPLAGGAEIVTEELCSRLARDGHKVILLTSSFPGALHNESRNGYEIVRIGGRFSCYVRAFLYYRANLRGKVDLIIDEMNTVPFFARLYARERVILFVHQLCREIWFYEMPWPLSRIGHWLEPKYLKLLASRSPPLPVITISNSTKNDLKRHGFNIGTISIIREGITIQPIAKIHAVPETALLSPCIVSVGAFRPMKRTIDIVEAFEVAKKSIPNAKLIMAGDASSLYGQSVLARIQASPYARDIDYRGRIREEEKIALLRDAHVLCVTSVKEGWGLVVTEAASQGTPAVVYNADGLRDSVQHEVTGLIVKENSQVGLAEAIAKLCQNPAAYQRMRENGWRASLDITFENCYQDFVQAMRK